MWKKWEKMEFATDKWKELSVSLYSVCNLECVSVSIIILKSPVNNISYYLGQYDLKIDSSATSSECVGWGR